VRYNKGSPDTGGETALADGTTAAIYVVDDDELFRSFVATLFQEVGYRTREFATGAPILPAIAEKHPEALVLDVNLPGLSGYEICREVRDAYGDAVAILFVSGERTEPFDRAAGLIVGADDYVAKPVDPGELIARVRRLIERQAPRETSARDGNGLTSLTTREGEVLELLSEGAAQDEIAEKLVISPKTVATHIQRILKKLNVRSRSQAVALALRQRN
jgi:DNA-binding NarL/FixJ family response regulator